MFDIAPEAEYYISAHPRKAVHQLRIIVDWMIEEDVDIILHPKDELWLTPGDGTGPLHLTSGLAPINSVDHAVEHGITWVSSAGNFANDVWAGPFSDIDGKGYHDFNSVTPGSDVDECNPVALDEETHQYGAVIRWDDTWGDLNSEVHLVLRNQDTLGIESTSSPLRIFPGYAAYPLETVVFTTPEVGGTYCLSVELKARAGKELTPPAWIQIHSLQHSLGNATRWGSISDTGEASNAGMLTVGAAAFDNTSEIYETSSRGPAAPFNTDGRNKPDVVGGVGTCELDGHQYWRGTGEAAAHVAGLAALATQRYPDYTPEQVTNYLRDNAASRPAETGDPNPTADANNTWGHGFAILPDDVEGVTPPAADTCVQTIDGSGTYTGIWDETCLSDKPAEQGSGDRYARFYAFTLDGSANVTIDLSSAEDAYLYLMKGTGRNGEVVESNDDIVSDNTNSQIPATLLEPGEYTIEATTYAARTSGDFTLVVDIDAIGEPPEPPPAVPYIAINSGANHVCAIATDGLIMCWGEDSEGQVSERPTSGHFTQISSGDNHTCALRDDGAVICWGSFDVP